MCNNQVKKCKQEKASSASVYHRGAVIEAAFHAPFKRCVTPSVKASKISFWLCRGCDGGCDVAPRYLYWQHIYHTLSLIAFICMGPSPVMLLEVVVPVCSFFFCPKAMQIHKHLFVAKQEGCVLLYTAKNGTVSSLIPTIILGKCLHALSHQLPVMFKSAWKKHIWWLWFLVMGLK